MFKFQSHYPANGGRPIAPLELLVELLIELLLPEPVEFMEVELSDELPEDEFPADEFVTKGTTPHSHGQKQRSSVHKPVDG